LNKIEKEKLSSSDANQNHDNLIADHEGTILVKFMHCRRHPGVALGQRTWTQFWIERISGEDEAG
jgi:hypothetical protein